MICLMHTTMFIHRPPTAREPPRAHAFLRGSPHSPDPAVPGRRRIPHGKMDRELRRSSIAQAHDKGAGGLTTAVPWDRQPNAEIHIPSGCSKRSRCKAASPILVGWVPGAGYPPQVGPGVLEVRRNERPSETTQQIGRFQQPVRSACRNPGPSCVRGDRRPPS
jgi:hypothetical protein